MFSFPRHVSPVKSSCTRIPLAVREWRAPLTLFHEAMCTYLVGDNAVFLNTLRGHIRFIEQIDKHTHGILSLLLLVMARLTLRIKIFAVTTVKMRVLTKILYSEKEGKED